MSHVIEVAFKGNRKEFFLWDGEAPPPLHAAVIVDADRGEDLGFVHATGELAEKRARGTPHGPGEAAPAQHARRLATTEEAKRRKDLAAQEDDARRKAIERVKANNLVMKVSDAEWQFDRKKLTLYFTAEKRVDFRALVRELAAMFRTRIELKQIGVRDEAKRLDGVGRCGRQYCSASFLTELRPVNLGVAKDQRLSLNPTQISGACGRLMCSLRYEHEFYVQSRKRFPKEGKVLRTSRGEEKVVANDIFRERVTLRSPEHETRVVPLVELRAEVEAAGGEASVVGAWILAAALDTAPIPSGASERGEPGADRLRRTPPPPPGERRRKSRDLDVIETLIAVQGSPDSIPGDLPEVTLPTASGPVVIESLDLTLGAQMDAILGAAPAASPTESAETAGERRPRRRGRRGGRRNRGRQGGAGASDSAPGEGGGHTDKDDGAGDDVHGED